MIQALSSRLRQEWKEHSGKYVGFFFILVFCLLRLPSLVEPYWYGDEGIYGAIGRALDAGRVLYKGIWDNKPPFLYIMYAIFHSDLFWVRMASLVFGAGAVCIFYLLAKKLFRKYRSQVIATTFFSIFFGLPLLEGNIANAENFMLALILLAFYLVVLGKYGNRRLKYIAAGILFSCAFLFKIVALFDLAAAITILFVERIDAGIEFPTRKKPFLVHTRALIRLFTDEILLGVAFLVPIFIIALYFFFQGALADFFRATFSQNVGYVGYGNRFLGIPQGLLILKLILLVIGIVAVWWNQKRLAATGVFIFVWFLFALFDAFFSQRPYTHYLLMLLPSFCLLIGYIYDAAKNKMISAGVLFITMVVVIFNFNFYTKIIPYYGNYFSFIFGAKPLDQYLGFFDHNTPRDYEVAAFIASHTTPQDSVFLWSDSGQIYVLANKLPPGRYIVAYHITFFRNAMDETRHDLQTARPKYIIDTKHSNELGQFLEGYELKYKIETADIYERQL